MYNTLNFINFIPSQINWLGTQTNTMICVRLFISAAAKKKSEALKQWEKLRKQCEYIEHMDLDRQQKLFRFFFPFPLFVSFFQRFSHTLFSLFFLCVFLLCTENGGSNTDNLGKARCCLSPRFLLSICQSFCLFIFLNKEGGFHLI